MPGDPSECHFVKPSTKCGVKDQISVTRGQLSSLNPVSFSMLVSGAWYRDRQPARCVPLPTSLLGLSALMLAVVVAPLRRLPVGA